VFGKDGEEVFVTGYETLENDRKLGQIYCTNRPSSIWRIPLPVDSDAKNDDDDDSKITGATLVKISEEGRLTLSGSRIRIVDLMGLVPPSTASH